MANNQVPTAGAPGTSPTKQTAAKQVKNDKYIEVIPDADKQAAQTLIDNAVFNDLVVLEADPNGGEPQFTPDSVKRLITKEDVEALWPVADALWHKHNYVPTLLDETTELLADAGIDIDYKDPKDKASMEREMLAYVYKTFRGHYKIYVNYDTEADSFDSMDLHEKGHVKFQHLDDVKLYKKQFADYVTSVWDEKVKKWFTDEAQHGIKKSKIVDFIYEQFANIAEDMEINSKLFPDMEWVDAKRVMSRSEIVVMHKALLRKFDETTGLIRDDKERKLGTPQNFKLVAKFYMLLDNLKRRAAGEIDDFLFCHPSYYDWPEKLDWFTYIMLLAKNQMDDVMQKLVNQAAAKAMGMGQGQGQGNGQFSSQNIDDYFNGKAGDGDAENSEGDKDDGEDESDGDTEPKSRSQGGHGRSTGKSGKPWVGQIETCATYDAFVKLLAKECLGHELVKRTTDVLYYSNRGKNMHMGGAVQPRRFRTAEWMPGACVIQVDISGSVSTDYVERIINSIVEKNSGIDLKKSRLIFCDTGVESDTTIAEWMQPGNRVPSGGGTRMASGMRYIKEKGYLNGQDPKYFLISDCEDDLGDWVQEMRSMPKKAKKFIIGYNLSGSSDFDPKTVMSRYVPSNSAGEELTSLAKILFITEVV
jgi:hypothetical protein